jgi:histidine triad (HIT) family protein
MRRATVSISATYKRKPCFMENCIFCKIASGELPSNKVYEDDDILAFHDIHPVAPVHFMIVPKLHIASLMDANMNHQALLGKMLGMAGELAKSQGLNDGFRTIINTGRVGRQDVYHLHMHIIGSMEVLPSMLPRA